MDLEVSSSALALILTLSPRYNHFYLTVNAILLKQVSDKKLLFCTLARPGANVLWVCQYYLHHPQVNFSIWNDLITPRKFVSWVYVINDFQIEQFEWQISYSSMRT
jgi:hypothetical protein